MRFPIYLLLLALIAVLGVYAAAPQQAIVVSYPNDTPDSVIAEAMAMIKEAVRYGNLLYWCETDTMQGGMITHEYKLIKGFAANAPAKALKSVQVMGAKYNALVESDSEVSINS